MLSPVQEEIVNQQGNLIVRASAGTGKTHTMVAKIAHDIEIQHSHKVVAAITFTIKAANEIRERLTIDADTHFIGTNNSFAIEEIIKPFMKDVYGIEYNIDISTDYSEKVESFQGGINKIKTERILCSYRNNKENFIFRLALDILRRSRACQLYLQAKYFKIYVDEYQDCDKDMHEFFMCICEHLKIDTFVVGDEKQSIYMWRGAYPKAFLSIWGRDDFNKKFMGDNFRSCQQIQNYSNLLCDETRGLYKQIDDLYSIILVNTTMEQWSDDILPYLDVNKKAALLRYSNANAEDGAGKLTSKGLEFTFIPQTPIAEITTDTAWLYATVARYFIIPTYSPYDLISEIPNEAVGNNHILTYVKKTLSILDKCIKEENIDEFAKQLENIAEYFGYTTRKEHTEKLYQTITDEKFYPAFNIDELDRLAITFHSSKGLEFEQVILFVSDYRLSDEQSIYNHYVAATRAKSKLILVYMNDNYNDKQFAHNLNAIFNKAEVRVSEVVTITK